MNTKSPSTLRTAVLERIARGDVRMHSRLYFALQLAIVILLGMLILGISVFLANFISFSMRIAGHDALLGFGARGVKTFLAIFPWGWLTADIILIALGSFLIRRFPFGYRRPVLFVAGGLLILALGFGVALDRATPLNEHLLRGADDDRLVPPFNTLYQGVHTPPPHDRGIFHGIVHSVGTSTFTISHDDFDHDNDDGLFLVLPPDGFSLANVSVGERVYIAGTPTPYGIEAYGIEELPSEE